MHRMGVAGCFAMVLLAAGCDRPLQDQTGRALTPAEESAWNLCVEWSARQGVEGPEQDDAFVQSDAESIGIVWTNDYPGGVDRLFCHADAAGQQLRSGIINGRVIQP